MNEANRQSQEEEIEVLLSIYGDSMIEVITRPSDDELMTELNIHIKPSSNGEFEINPEDHIFHLFQTGFTLNVKCSDLYPSEKVPEFSLVPPVDLIKIYCPPHLFEEHESFKEKRVVAREVQQEEITEISNLVNVSPVICQNADNRRLWQQS